jgi:dipeptidyl aminopeptidase/acylaminoacyl peptidase
MKLRIHRAHCVKLAGVALMIAGLIPLVAPEIAMAQQTRELPVGVAVNARRFAPFNPVTFSPDGKYVAYTVIAEQKTKELTDEMSYEKGIPWWGIGGQVFIRDLETRETTQLTTGAGDNWLPTWSPDGQYLAFFSDRDASGRAKLWAWEVQGKILKKVSDTNVIGDTIAWNRQGKRVLVSAVPPSQKPDASDSSPLVDGKASQSTVTVYRVQGNGPARPASAPWSLKRRFRDIDFIDVATGVTDTIVHAQNVSKFILSPQGAEIAYTSPKGFDNAGSQQILYDLVMVDIVTRKGRILASDIRLNYLGDSFSWSPDGTKLSFRTDGMEERTYDCFVVELNNGRTRNVSALSPEQRPESYKSLKPLWSTDGTYLYFIRGGNLWRDSLVSGTAAEIARIPDRQITGLISRSDNVLWTPGNTDTTVVLTHDDSEKQDGLYEIDLIDGVSKKLIEQGQCYSCMQLRDYFMVVPDGQTVAYFAEDAQHDTDLWMISSRDYKPKRQANLNPEFDNYRMGETRLIDWLSDDGEHLHGALLLPSDYQPGKRYPMIVWVYGGLPLSTNLNRFGLAYLSPFNMQLFATRGYAVLLPDAPQHLATPMLDLAKTVLPGVNKAIDLGIADPNRVGVMGHSYGGYSTLSLIVQTERFKAAIAIDGWADLWSAYGEMGKDGTAYATGMEESSEGLALMGGTPWQVRTRYIENSPAFYFDRVETPLLVVHGAEDSALNPFLGDQVFVALRRLGKKVEYAKYAGEGHDPSEWNRANQIDLSNRMIEWFDRHLKVKTDAPPASLPSGPHQPIQ